MDALRQGKRPLCPVSTRISKWMPLDQANKANLALRAGAVLQARGRSNTWHGPLNDVAGPKGHLFALIKEYHGSSIPRDPGRVFAPRSSAMRRATEEAHITCSKSRNVYTWKVDAGALITGQREQTLMTSLWAQQPHKCKARA